MNAGEPINWPNNTKLTDRKGDKRVGYW